MNADIQGALNQINKSWRAFTHKGRPMTKEQVKAVLEFGLSKGYNSTGDIPDEDIDRIIKNLPF